jgi:hypothetical protein
MKYWVLKGKPWNFEEGEYAKPGNQGRWGASRLPKEVTRNDRLFVWESSPATRLVALGRLQKVYVRKSRAGKTLFDVVYLAKLLETISIVELRQYRSLRDASFLKSGPFATVYPLSNDQGESLFRIAALRNPDLWSVWSDIAVKEHEEMDKPIASSLLAPPLRVEVIINRIIRDTAKTKLLKIKYGHRCQLCGERIEVRKGKFYAEVHHIRPLGGKHKGLDKDGNMIVLCPNHHAMFDFGIPRFLSNTKVQIGSRRYTLITRHKLNEESVSYHNKRIFGSNT